MKKYIRIVLFTGTLSSLSSAAFAQTVPDKIIFLTDFYTTYIDKVETDPKNVDKIYTELVQTPICNKYFQKSEYADLVKGFLASPVQNTTELKKSVDRITQNKEVINTKIISALKKSKAQLDNDSLTIYILPVSPESRMIAENMLGVMGLTAGSKQILLAIEPDISGWENMLGYAVAHEFNHAYWTNMNFGKSTKWTLLDYLIFEGRGDYFAHLLYPNVKAPWTMALTENQKADVWKKIKPNLQSEDFALQQEIMFGSLNYPIWGGYSVGYDIVFSALENNKILTADIWANLDSDKILAQSKYK